MKRFSLVLWSAIVLTSGLSQGELCALPSENGVQKLFKRVNIGGALEGHVISIRHARSELECSMRCQAHALCLSYNFKEKEENSLGQHSCELNSRTATKEMDQGFGRQGFLYYEFVNINTNTLDSVCDCNTCQNNGTCVFLQGRFKCICPPYFNGERCEISLVQDCQAWNQLNKTTSGIYSINPNGLKTVDVYCDQETDGGGWTVFQRRFSPFAFSFSKGWWSYWNGFGKPSDEYWLGLKFIRRISGSNSSKLRIDLSARRVGANFTEHGFAVYSDFGVHEYAAISVGALIRSNGLGDCLHTSNDEQFKSFEYYDQGNYSAAHDCSRLEGAGWWYRNCTDENNLNAQVKPKWNCWDDELIGNIVYSELKTRKNN